MSGNPFDKFDRPPDRVVGMANYAILADSYDQTTHRVRRIWRDAVESLALQPGERVLDVACGTGETTLLLARAMGSRGKVLGVEQSAEMVRVARPKLAAHVDPGVSVSIQCTGVEQLNVDDRFDAVLMMFTHDAQWTPGAIECIARHCRPGARLAIAGMRFVPWWWGAPINLVSAFRARRYMTTYVGLRRPWEPLLAHVSSFRVQQYYLFGSCYRASAIIDPPDVQR